MLEQMNGIEISQDFPFTNVSKVNDESDDEHDDIVCLIEQINFIHTNYP